MIRREESRLKSVFRQLLVMSVVGPIVSCSSRAESTPDDAGTAVDATVASDATDVDASLVPDAATVPDSAPDPCAPKPYVPPPDAGYDASDPCGQLVRLECGPPSDVLPRANCFFAINDCDRSPMHDWT